MTISEKSYPFSMNLSNLPKLVVRSKKRLGRGHGSGKVKTAGRGTKGQKARGSMPADFEGGQLPLTKRLPLLRGKGKNKSQALSTFPLSVDRLNSLPGGAVISLELLKKRKLIAEDVRRVKLLGTSKLSHAYTVQIPCSEGAKSSIEKAGGTVQ